MPCLYICKVSLTRIAALCTTELLVNDDVNDPQLGSGCFECFEVSLE